MAGGLSSNIFKARAVSVRAIARRANVSFTTVNEILSHAEFMVFVGYPELPYAERLDIALSDTLGVLEHYGVITYDNLN